MMRSQRKRMLVGIAASTVLFTGIGLWLMSMTKGVTKPEMCGDEGITQIIYHTPISEHKDLYDPLCKEYGKGGDCIEVVPEWEAHRLPYQVWGYVPQVTPLPEPSSRFRPAPRTYEGWGGSPRVRTTGTPGAPGEKACDVPEPSIFWLSMLGLAGLGAVRWSSKN